MRRRDGGGACDGYGSPKVAQCRSRRIGAGYFPCAGEPKDQYCFHGSRAERYLSGVGGHARRGPPGSDDGSAVHSADFGCSAC